MPQTSFYFNYGKDDWSNNRILFKITGQIVKINSHAMPSMNSNRKVVVIA